MSKGRLLGLISGKITLTKDKDSREKKEREGSKEEKRKKQWLHSFIMATLEIVFGRKNTVGRKRSIWR